MNRDDLLTWKGVRALCEYEALTPTLTPNKVLLTSMIPERPQITWPHQYHWFARAERLEPPAGATIYGRAVWAGRWRKDLLKQVTQPSVLVSNFYDLMIQPKTVEALFREGSNISRWFAVQTMVTHPRLTAMPLGVKHRMVPVLQAGERLATRDILCYGNFSYLRIGKTPDPVRQAVWAHFSALPWVTTRFPDRDDPISYVSDLGRSQFVLSPPGIGYDCYRTYEAIIMGAIPIVKRQRPITDVCENLPVLMIDDWSEVTEERLAHAWMMRPYVIDARPLTLRYWQEKIRDAADAALKEVLSPDSFPAQVSQSAIQQKELS